MYLCPSVLITGSGRGIGRGIAIHAARSGWSVGLNYLRNRVAADETLAYCEEQRVNADQEFVMIQADVANAGDRSKLIGLMLSGTGGLDALVNNAGIAPRERKDILDATEDSFREVLETNLTGPYFLTQAAGRVWLEAHRKSRGPAGFIVVNISSVSAESASTNRGEYCVSKAGLAMATKLWASRLAPHGIHVLEIRPGIIESDMTAGVREKYDAMIEGGLVPEQRWGTPDDVGKVLAAILRGDLPYTSGSVIHVDGGLNISRL